MKKLVSIILVVMSFNSFSDTGPYDKGKTNFENEVYRILEEKIDFLLYYLTYLVPQLGESRV